MKDFFDRVLKERGVDPDQIHPQTLIGNQDIELYVHALNFTMQTPVPESLEQISSQSREKLDDVFTMMVFTCFQACLIIGRYRAPDSTGTFITDGDIELLGMFLSSHPDIEMASIFPSREEVWKVWHTHPSLSSAMSVVSDIFREDLAGPDSRIIEARNFS